MFIVSVWVSGSYSKVTGVAVRCGERRGSASGQGAAECAGTGKAYKERGKLRNFVETKQLVLLGVRISFYISSAATVRLVRRIRGPEERYFVKLRRETRGLTRLKHGVCVRDWTLCGKGKKNTPRGLNIQKAFNKVLWVKRVEHDPKVQAD